MGERVWVDGPRGSDLYAGRRRLWVAWADGSSDWWEAGISVESMSGAVNTARFSGWFKSRAEAKRFVRKAAGL